MKALLKLVRFQYTDVSTIGILYFNGTQFCYTIEDTNRDSNKDGDLKDAGEAKVYGQTAIPAGTYKVTLFNSPKHGLCPLLHNVEGFSMIEIHKGNTAKDSLGCILVGTAYSTNMVKNSKKAFDALMEELKKYKEIEITIIHKV